MSAVAMSILQTSCIRSLLKPHKTNDGTAGHTTYIYTLQTRANWSLQINAINYDHVVQKKERLRSATQYNKLGAKSLNNHGKWFKKSIWHPFWQPLLVIKCQLAPYISYRGRDETNSEIYLQETRQAAKSAFQSISRAHHSIIHCETGPSKTML